MEAQQTPLRTAIMRIMSDMLDNPCEHGLFDTGRFMDKIEQLICDMMAAPETLQLSASEALFGFLGWLTTRDETTVLGPHETPDVTIVSRFIETNYLTEPRAGWDLLLTHPEPLEPEPTESEPEDPEKPTESEPEDPEKPTLRGLLDAIIEGAISIEKGVKIEPDEKIIFRHHTDTCCDDAKKVVLTNDLGDVLAKGTLDEVLLKLKETIQK